MFSPSITPRFDAVMTQLGEQTATKGALSPDIAGGVIFPLVKIIKKVVYSLVLAGFA